MAVVTTNLGVVTAYGDAVRGGYTGTKEQWEALMADYGTIGTQAQTDAQTASTAAQTATTAAQTATTKASEASASATAAAASAASIGTPDTTLTQAGKAADAKATGDEISSLKEDFTDIINSAYVTDSASGSVAHFVDGADGVPMKSVKVNIDPVQSGSGDPSPSNVRAISGWNSVNVYVSPTTDSEDATVYNISLSSAGTVYGGTLDVVSGELTVDKKKFTIDGSNYALGVLSGIYNNRYCYRNTYLGSIIEKNLPSETTKACCNILKSISRSNATSAPNGIFQYHGDNDELRFLFPLEDAYSTPDNIYALGLECCIPLATPIAYQLTAQEIKSLLGINTVWSDAGDVDVEYRADTKLYIDKRLGV